MTNGRPSKESAITVYIGLGSNIGDRLANLRDAAARITMLGIEVVRESSVYETEPAGFADQPWFLNQVIEARILGELESESGPVIGNPQTIATLQAEALLSKLLTIEREMGRERTFRNGPRVIDIDLLLFGDKVIERYEEGEEGSSIEGLALVVPHPRMHQRRFVLEPLCEIAPTLVHPALKRTCREILALLEDNSKVRSPGSHS